MAAPRKYVRTIMSHENSAMQMLYKTGVCTTQQLEAHFNIKGPRLKKLCNSQYLKEIRGKVWLGEKGIKHLERKLGMEHRYKTSVRQTEHDLRLTEKYLELPKDIQQSWKTEAQLRNEAMKDPRYREFKHHIEGLHPQGHVHATPDAAIYSPEHGGYIAVEITTQNYKDIDIQQKMEFSNTFLSGYQQY